jgi:hypothetical protein
VLYPTLAGAGVAGAAGALPRPARRAHRLSAAHPRGLLPPGHHSTRRGRRDPRAGPAPARTPRRGATVTGPAAAGDDRARRSWTPSRSNSTRCGGGSCTPPGTSPGRGR